MSCQSNSNKSKWAAVKCGISRAASATAYVAGMALGGAVVGAGVTASPVGLVAGAVTGAGVAVHLRRRGKKALAEIEKAVKDGTAKYVVTDPLTRAEYVSFDSARAADFAAALGTDVTIVAPGVSQSYYDEKRLAIPPGASSPASAGSGVKAATTGIKKKLMALTGRREMEWAEAKRDMRNLMAQTGQWDKSRRFMRLKTDEGNAVVLSKAEVDFYRQEDSPGNDAALVEGTRRYYEGRAVDKTAPSFTTIEDGEWDKQFKPERNAHNAYRLYDTLGEIDDTVPAERIWTLREEDGQPYISPGLHEVNRLGYYVTENEWHTPNWQVEIPEAV